MQNNAMSDVRLVFIAGIQIGGLLRMSESGVEEDPIEVPETGKIRLIGSGTEKIMPLELEYLIKRNSPTLKYFQDWRDSGKFARDVTMYYTDKSGNFLNSYRRDLFTSCELGTFKNPTFDEGQKDKAKLTITLFPYDYDTRSLV